MKSIVLCADDYGQNAAISQAIINLFKKNRLSATSCMVTATDWLGHSEWLHPFKNTVDIGLHFNLTEGHSLSQGLPFDSLPQLIAKSYLKKLDKKSLEDEFHAQLDQFSGALGQLPHFIDGHQHIHQLPMIRDVLVKGYHQRLKNSGCYIRSVWDPRSLGQVFLREGFKYFIIQLCGAKAFRHMLECENIPHNTSFSGIYDFQKAAQYAAIFPSFLQKISEKGLIMCHPGLDSEGSDQIKSSRPFEYAYFQSEEFRQLCELNNIKLTRFNANITLSSNTIF